MVQLMLGGTLLAVCWFVLSVVTASGASAAEPGQGGGDDASHAAGLGRLVDEGSGPVAQVTAPVAKAASPATTPVGKTVHALPLPPTAAVRPLNEAGAGAVRPLVRGFSVQSASVVEPVASLVAEPVRGAVLPVRPVLRVVAPVPCELRTSTHTNGLRRTAAGAKLEVSVKQLVKHRLLLPQLRANEAEGP